MLLRPLMVHSDRSLSSASELVNGKILHVLSRAGWSLVLSCCCLMRKACEKMQTSEP